jgi:hypothetical protein
MSKKKAKRGSRPIVLGHLEKFGFAVDADFGRM